MKSFFRVVLPVALVFLRSRICGGAGSGAASTSVEVPSGIDHSAWGRLLAEYVDEKGRVAYARLAASASDRDSLRAYVAQFAQTGTAPADGPERIASLINAYNAFTISWILENYPTSSIRSTSDPFKGRRYDVGGRKVSVDDIEHTMLRPTAGFRVHAAISCASRSCPPLSREAYAAATLDASLDAGMRRWLAREDLNRFLPAQRKAEVSKLFKWFKEDFEKGNKGFSKVEDVFAKYADQLADAPGERQSIRARTATIAYLDYDWSLNDVGR